MTNSNDTVEPGGGSARSARERRIAHFRIVRMIGSGGQGEVYEAVDEQLGRRVALKLLSRRTDFLAPETRTKVRARFEREAEVTARLDHPGICAVYEFGEDDGLPWIAMRLVDGEPLKTLIAKSREISAASSSLTDACFVAAVSENDSTAVRAADRRTPATARGVRVKAEVQSVIKVIESAARALHAAHEAGLVHRDIKPDNIMVTPAGQAVILDFGLAADEHTDGPDLTLTGEFMGTPAYMSPEQLTAQRIHVDRRSDVYSLGVTLFECLTLRRPFEAPSREALYRDILAKDAPDLRRLNAAVSRDLATVTLSALEKHPDRRYQTSEDFAEDLRRVREYEPIHARPPGPITRVVRWAQRNPAVATLLSAIFLSLTVGILWTTAKNRELATATTEARGNARQARESAEESRRNQEIAQAEARAKATALSEYERMADTRRLVNANAAADELWPVHPKLEPRIRAWQAKYEPLRAHREDHARALDELRTRAQPYTEEDRARDFAKDIECLQRHETEEPKLHTQLEALTGEKERAIIKDLIEQHSKEAARHRELIRGRESWNFGDDVDAQFRHDTLQKLVADLRAFGDEETGTWASVTTRLDCSRRIHRETIKEHAGAWRKAVARIASNPKYGGLSIEPQIGLIPLGPDPASGLEEFLHWQTHDWSDEDSDLPERDERGRLLMTEGCGLVFVLIPDGSFLMGAQKEDPSKPNFDPDAFEDESPVHEVVLSAYFLSKFEMTQGQWLRFTGGNPSTYAPPLFIDGFEMALVIFVIRWST